MTESLPQIDPRRTALLVMDYQNGVVDMLGEPDDLLTRPRTASPTCTSSWSSGSFRVRPT